ncbi:MAG: hypothetical protein R2710_11485 [Acidimicrobiales bacterium]
MDPDHGRQVAIKVLDVELGDTERRRFDRATPVDGPARLPPEHHLGLRLGLHRQRRGVHRHGAGS